MGSATRRKPAVPRPTGGGIMTGGGAGQREAGSPMGEPQPEGARRQGAGPAGAPAAGAGREQGRLHVVGDREESSGTSAARGRARRATRSGRGTPPPMAGPGGEAAELSIAERIDRISERLLEVRPAGPQTPAGKAPARREWKRDPDRVVARLIKLLPALRLHGDVQLVVNAGIAVEHLRRSPPNLGLAAEIVDDLRCATGFRTPASFYLMAGMAGFVAAAGLAFLALQQAAHAYGAWQAWYGVGLFGGLGSIASIASRFSEYRTTYTNSARALVGHGLAKPLLGVILGLFLAMAVEAGLIPLEQGAGRPALVMALAFVAGFSERLARDVAGRVESLAGVGPGSRARQP